MALENLPLEEYKPDVEEYWDRIFTGPHGELLEMIANFNSSYVTDIGLTKKLQWKRGSYDKVKETIMKRALQLTKRPRGMDSIFRNIDNGQWSLNNMKRKLNVIQDKIYRLKWQGTTLDTDLAKNAFNFFLKSSKFLASWVDLGYLINLSMNQSIHQSIHA